nr:hypothetical protein [Tanacetum cinerariifolium]
TQAVYRAAGHRYGQAGQQGSHASHVAVIFTALVGGAHYHVFYGVFIHARVAAQQLAQHQGRQVVGANAAERATKFSNRGAHGIHDICIRHSLCIVGAAQVRQLKANFGLPARAQRAIFHNHKDDTKNPKRIFIAAGPVYAQHVGAAALAQGRRPHAPGAYPHGVQFSRCPRPAALPECSTDSGARRTLAYSSARLARWPARCFGLAPASPSAGGYRRRTGGAGPALGLARQ